MKEVLRLTRFGLRDLPGMGPHPGGFTLGAAVLLAAILGGWRGALLFLVGLGWLYLLGAYDRGKEWEAGQGK